MRRKLLSVFVLVLGIVAIGFAQEQANPLAKPADIIGAWDMTWEGPQGKIDRTITFTQENNVIKVEEQSPLGEARGGEVTVEGNNIKWTITISTSQGELTVRYKGVIDGDKMKGEVDMGELGTAEFTGQKKK
jgi:hypothetical protein